MRRPLVILLALVLAGSALAACGDDPEDVGAGPSEEPAADDPTGLNDPLQGRQLTVVEASGHEIVAGTTIALAFADGQVTVEAGCNHLSGAYSYEDADADSAVLVVDGLGGTEMGCDPALMDQDAWIGTFLAARPVVETASDGEVVTLTAGEDVLTLADEAPEPTAELVGPTWALDTLIEGTDAEGTAASVPAGVEASITFAADGTYEVAAGCNTGSGTYTEAGAGIYQIGAPGLTRRRCDGEATEVEAAVVAVLDGEVSVSIEADRLTIQADDTGLGFRTG